VSRPTINKNGRLGLVLCGVAVGMIGLSFAAVPLYRIFCQATGFGGTPQIVTAGSIKTLERMVTVRFNTDVDRNLNWYFQPEQKSERLKLGEQGLAFFRAKNLSDKAIVGTAVFNVTPLKAGEYFNKIQCFCFTEQRLEPGQSVDMPVAFYVDPRLNDDPSMADVTTITLSYTFYEALDPKPTPQTTAQLSKSPASASRN
jgi:cytochrome c oxidase assembly protein subunit 11